MKIEQIQKDLDEGVIVSRDTWGKLLQAAKIMNDTLHKIADDSDDVWAANESLIALVNVESL